MALELETKIIALPGFGVKLSPDRLVVSEEAGGEPSRNVRTDALRGQDVLNGTILVPNQNTTVVRVPSGAVYHVRLVNTGTGDIYISFGAPATTQMFPLVPGQALQERVAGDITVYAISNNVNGEPLLVWVSELL